MIGQLRNLLPLMTGAFFLLVGSTLLSYILQLALEQNGGSDLAGFGFAAYYLGFSVGVLRVRPIIESVGHIRTFAAFATLLSSITLIHPLTEQSELPRNRFGARRFGLDLAIDAGGSGLEYGGTAHCLRFGRGWDRPGASRQCAGNLLHALCHGAGGGKPDDQPGARALG